MPIASNYNWEKSFANRKSTFIILERENNQSIEALNEFRVNQAISYGAIIDIHLSSNSQINKAQKKPFSWALADEWSVESTLFLN
jgi:hypothetical protein